MQDAEKQPRLGLMQELVDTRKENCAVKSSNSQLKEELTRYKTVVHSLETQGFALQSHCSVADETKLVTSKVGSLRCLWPEACVLPSVYLDSNWFGSDMRFLQSAKSL